MSEQRWRDIRLLVEAVVLRNLTVREAVRTYRAWGARPDVAWLKELIRRGERDV